MNARQQFSVATQNVSVTDRAILKLIFAVSKKLPNRKCSFRLDDDGYPSADILIRFVDSSDIDSCSGDVSEETGHPICILLTDGINIENEHDAFFVLSRPLLATRTLSLLDGAVDGLLGNDNIENDIISSEANAFNDDENIGAVSIDREEPTQPEIPSLEERLEEGEAIGLEEVLLEEPVDEIEFSITEEEASELAIVADVSLSNPANNDIHDTYLEDTFSDNQNVTGSPSVADEKRDLVEEPSASSYESSQEKIDESTLDENSVSQDSNVPRVLVVDDSASVRKQLELELMMFNAEVDYAGDACVANGLLEKNSYDVAFLDVVLPDGDGFQICKDVKSISKNTSVIMLTGKATPADKIKGTLSGCDAYLVKPVGRDIFQTTVKNYLTMLEPLSAVNA